MKTCLLGLTCLIIHLRFIMLARNESLKILVTSAFPRSAQVLANGLRRLA